LLTLTSWSIEAENRKAKRSDCEGAGETSYVIGMSLTPGSP
jgi:hypothetical protein